MGMQPKIYITFFKSNRKFIAFYIEVFYNEHKPKAQKANDCMVWMYHADSYHYFYGVGICVQPLENLLGCISHRRSVVWYRSIGSTVWVRKRYLIVIRSGV